MTVLPSDPLFATQWHLLNTGQLTTGTGARYDIGVTGAWDDYTGRGVLVAISDTGVDGGHPDLNANFRADLSYDVSSLSQVVSDGDGHGTAVAGLIAAPLNGVGGVGVAYDAQFSMLRGIDLDNWLANAPRLVVQTGAAIHTNSWGPMNVAFDHAGQQADVWAAMRMEAAEGRGGLGTVVLFAAGNDRDPLHDGSQSFNTNVDPVNNSPYAIQVAALNNDGTHSSYSTPGASVLIAAPGSGLGTPPGQTGGGGDGYGASIATTDARGADGFATGDYLPGLDANGNWAAMNGTSAATPIAAGATALVLQANPTLGYRDVQEILAYSARQVTPGDAGWQANGAHDWNGGAHYHSADAGFGGLDVTAAVRLAETWGKQDTIANLQTVSGAVNTPTLTLAPGTTATATATFAQPLRVEQVQVSVHVTDPHIDDLTCTLTSPTGTVSALMTKLPTVSASGDDVDPAAFKDLSWTFNTVADWGENAQGTWTLSVTDAAGGLAGTVDSWSITAMGSAWSRDETYVYTNDYSRLANADAARATLVDGDGGSDTINAAAITGNSVVNLTTGSVGSLGGTDFSIGTTGSVRTVFTGDGDDTLAGVANDETLRAGRGADLVSGGAGGDILYGNQGNDALFGNEGADTLFGGQGGDVEFGGHESDVLYGNLADDALYGGAGNDTLFGGQGADRLNGDSGDDLLAGNLGDDTLTGGAGADRFLFGANSGNDVVTDFNADEGDRLQISPGLSWTVAEGATGAVLSITGGASVTLTGIHATQVTAGWFVG